MKWISVLIVILVSLGCAANKVDVAKEAVESTVGVKEEVYYRGVNTYPGNVVCGEAQIIGSWTSGVDFHPFIFRDDILYSRPSIDDETFFCSEDPAAALYQTTGINAAVKSESLQSIEADYALLVGALEQYHANNYSYPTSGSGLSSLVGAGSGREKSGPLADGGYLTEVPVDPWGRAYEYTGPGMGGIKSTFKLLTLGADGERGGRDEDADVGHWQMKYLQHIESI
ncbi:MAG: type II secretion system protein GspG [Halioglobus sp.]